MKAIAFDWRAPDYGSVLAVRMNRLQRIRSNPAALAALRLHYQQHPADFINDWGTTFDPRNAERGLPTVLPFVLWPKQREWIEWVMERWQAGEGGITEKSRDSGVTWLAVALSCSLCLFNRSLVVGFGSRKVEYVDQLGAPKSILEKARLFMSNLPPEFRDGWQRDRHAPYMKVMFPGSGSIITGEGGDSIGRGDRTSLYFVDEAAFLERPELVDASLSATTNCRIDISTPNGRANPFAIKRHSGKVKVFTFHWRDDPRKGDAWYRNQVDTLDPVTLAQEVDINYAASVEGVLIPSEWVNAAVDVHVKLGITPSGWRRAGLDVADEGRDSNSIACRHGILLEHLETWSGKGSDIYATTVRAFDIAERHRQEFVQYDSDGLGAGVRGDSRVINTLRAAEGRPAIHAEPYWGSGAVCDPDAAAIQGAPGGKTNKDMFANLKGQSWWSLRRRFEATWRAVRGLPFQADDLISIPSTLAELTPLLLELSQSTFRLNNSGKIIVEKAPEGTLSPNRADAVVIAFNPGTITAQVWAMLGRLP